MPASNKGSLAEKWYHRVYAPESAAHVRVDEALLASISNSLGREVKERVIDLVDTDGTLREIKHVSGTLSERELSQFEDYMGLVGREAPLTLKDGTEVVAKKVVYTFIDPAGARANIKFIKDALAERKQVSFEVFNSKGEFRHVRSTEEIGDVAQWLGVTL